MANIGQILINVYDPFTNSFTSSFNFIGYTEELVEKGSKWTKLSIQAPPGTKFQINSSDRDDVIIIGRTGIYELPPNIEVNSFKIPTPINWVIDEGLAAAEKLRFAAKELKATAENLQDNQTEIKGAADANTDEDDLDNLKETMKTYIEAINIEELNEAIVLWNNANMTAYTNGGTIELTNVIIDYISETDETEVASNE